MLLRPGTLASIRHHLLRLVAILGGYFTMSA